MKMAKGLINLSTIFGVTAYLAAGGAAAQDDLRQLSACFVETRATPDSPPQRQLCRGGMLADARSGRPLLDRNRRPVGCACPEAEGEWDPMLVGAGGLAALGLGVGIALAASSGHNGGGSIVIPPPLPASP